MVQPPQGLQFHNENFVKGVSFPLKFHEDFEVVGENVDEESLEDFSVIGHALTNLETHSQNEFYEEAMETKAKSSNISPLSNCQNSITINVESLTEINC